MKSATTASLALCTATAALLLVSGCGDKSTSSSSSSTTSASATSKSTSTSNSPAASEQDLSKLLISADEIAAPGDVFTAQEPTLNPGGKPGVATVFSNAKDTREIGDTIFVLPDAAAANTALQGAVAAFASTVTGTPESADVGTSGTMVSGTSPDGAKSITVLVFTRGTAFTTLEFDGGPGDAVPAEFVLDVAKKQDAKLKAGLGG
ncbi:MAG: hypothetical protein M3O32_06045 [Actinomycetota bacterium]|nr:hypothetical protein [Actinomycetota bacterium]